ncbi:hypothetical protein B9Z55_024290 [Caenorhabditis nigoni]|uniref:RING-type domain-containing protein n=1 Tax=Caenorhabditis nigoni TaxID=1611254 RepID=A0A2G5STB9_9PELO|nr:hypothetical protein B9Z55_024290 [Caenorhabditis nigoni]
MEQNVNDVREEEVEVEVEEEEEEEEEEKYVWIYFCPDLPSFCYWKDQPCYEFHPDLQDHIEESYQSRAKTCKVNETGSVWIINFVTKTRSDGECVPQEIERISVSERKDFNILGVAGVKYPNLNNFQQTDSMCYICYCEQTIPTRIDACGHSFCFMCLKSVPVRKCPTCRGNMPETMFNNPRRYDVDVHMKCPPEVAADVFSYIKRQEGGTIFKSKKPGNRKFYWIYQARLFWYRYDPRTELVLEDCYRKNKKRCEVEICGKKFTIDIEKKIQVRGERHSERRCIQRIEAEDIYRYDVRGIAGIQCHFFPVTNRMLY